MRGHGSGARGRAAPGAMRGASCDRTAHALLFDSHFAFRFSEIGTECGGGCRFRLRLRTHISSSTYPSARGAPPPARPRARGASALLSNANTEAQPEGPKGLIWPVAVAPGVCYRLLQAGDPSQATETESASVLAERLRRAHRPRPKQSQTPIQTRKDRDCLPTAKSSYIYELVRRLVRRLVKVVGVVYGLTEASNIHTRHMPQDQEPLTHTHTHTSVHTPWPRTCHFFTPSRVHRSMNSEFIHL